MCGIIGLKSKNTVLLRETLIALLKESQIRGQHATGVTYVKDKQLVTVKAPVSANVFIEQYLPVELGELVMGHVRYSTSALGYDQPLTANNVSLVHNGVITQTPFDKWPQLYGIDQFNTQNDSEILLQYIASKRDWFNFKDSSIACGYIQAGELYCYRNTKRPLYLFGNTEITGFASTDNILRRAIPYAINITSCTPGTLYHINADGYIIIKNNALNAADLQQSTVNSIPYLAEGRIRY